MRTRVGLFMALAIGVPAVLIPSDGWSKGTFTPCPGGRYVITGNPRSTGKPTLKSGTITLRNQTVSLSAGCPATAVVLKHMKRGMGMMKGGTRVRAKWAQCSGVRGKVRLKAGIDSTCKRMWGSIRTKKGKSRFDAELSLCGNGVVDSGEQCDGAACTNGAPCTDSCECDLDGIPGPGCTPGVDGCPGHHDGSSTTTTVVPGGGGGVTTTSLQNGGGPTTTTTTVRGSTTSTTLPGDHFKCYKVHEGGGRFHPGPVSLIDQFGAAANVVEEAQRFCNPVDKNGEGIDDPTAHLMCYDLATQKGFAKREVVVRNQFGDQILTVVRPDSLCVPAEKDMIQSALDLNHFKCYRVAQRYTKFASRVVTLADQFETKTTIVQRPVLMCNPVDKNGEGIVDPAGHLTCYRIIDASGQAAFAPKGITVSDQFTDQNLKVFRGTCRQASLLCVPSLKNPGNNTTTTTLQGPTSTSTSSTSSTTSTSLRGSTSTSSTTSTSVTSSTSTTIRATTTSTTSTSSTTSPTPTTSTTSTSSTSSTTSPTPTTSSTSTTSTSTSSTSTSSAPVPTTSSTTTSTSSTTSTTGGPQCCNGASHVSFLTADAPGDCGDIFDSDGNLVSNINCAGLYTGGGGNSVPLPFAVPDLGFAINSITSCSGQAGTLGATTSTETGSKKNCTSPGCFFGAPLAVPNPGTTATSVCVVNTLSTVPTGTLNCSTGATNLSLPLSSILFLTGDTATDPGTTIPGIQPCPLCSNLTCVAGANNGMACVAGTTTLNGNPAYPTSNDCPPDPMFNIGTLPVAFRLSNGTVSWTGTIATNDTGFAGSVQSRVFSGFCRDVNQTGCFKGNPDTMCPAGTPGFAQCWENGMAVGSACIGTFESCEQRTNGAFGPGGGTIKTITAIGTGGSLLGGPSGAKLVSVFSIPPTFNATVDAAGDLPGPGAVALPGTATLCSNAMCIP
jgi:hypothetical protein